MKHFFTKRRLIEWSVIAVIGLIFYLISPMLFGLYVMGATIAKVGSSFGRAFDANEGFAEKNQGASQKMGHYDGPTDDYLNNDYK